MLIPEIIIFLASGTVVLHSLIKRKILWLSQLFVPLTVMTLIVENEVVAADILIYDPEFSIWMFRVPLCIGLGWCLIIYFLLQLVKTLNFWHKNNISSSILCGMLGTMIALPIELIVNGSNLLGWRWSIDGSFSVPVRNFVGWFLNIFLFTLLFQYVMGKKWNNIKKLTFLLLISPVLAFLNIYALVAVGNFIA